MSRKSWDKLWRRSRASVGGEKLLNTDFLDWNASVFRTSLGTSPSRFVAVTRGSDEHHFALDFAREVLDGRSHVLSGQKEWAGVWRLFQPGGFQLQFLVGSGDTATDAEMTQCLHYYGTPIGDQFVEDRLFESRFGRVAALCGEASTLVKEIMKLLGHDARVVTSLRRGNFNSYDNGHTVLEIIGEMGNGKVFDPGYGGWLTQQGEKINLTRLRNSINEGLELEFEPISFRHYGKFFSSKLADLTFELEAKWSSPDEIIRWYREVFQIVGVERKWFPGQFEFLTSSDSEKRIVEQYSKQYFAISREEFLMKYAETK